MRSNALLCFVTAMAVVVAACQSTALADKLRIQDIAGNDRVVVMGDARSTAGAGSQCVNDRVSRSTGELELPNLLPPAGCNSEISIFAADNAMVHAKTADVWTTSPDDMHTVTLPPIIKVRVHVWIAYADPTAAENVRLSAVQDMKRANALYKRNKVGVQFVPAYIKVSDMPTNQAGRDGIVTTINAGIGDGCENIAAIQASAGNAPGLRFYVKRKLNVYYVDEDFGGRNCAILKTPTNSCETVNGANNPKGDGNITFIGTGASRTTLAHEFGHAFGLRPGPCGGHTDGVPGIGQVNNIMLSSGGDERTRFTLGQVFRMNTQADDWGGTMLIANGDRPGPGRKCPPLKSNSLCPALKADWARP